MSNDDYSDNDLVSEDDSINLNEFPRVLRVRGLSTNSFESDTEYSEPERDNQPTPPMDAGLINAFHELSLSIKTNRNHPELRPDVL